MRIVKGECVYLRNNLLCIGSVAGACSEVAACPHRIAKAGEDDLLDGLLRGAGQGSPSAEVFGYELDLAVIIVPRLYLCRVVLRDEHADVISPHCLDEYAFRLAKLLLKYNQQVVLGFQE